MYSLRGVLSPLYTVVRISYRRLACCGCESWYRETRFSLRTLYTPLLLVAVARLTEDEASHGSGGQLF